MCLSPMQPASPSSNPNGAEWNHRDRILLESDLPNEPRNQICYERTDACTDETRSRYRYRQSILANKSRQENAKHHSQRKHQPTRVKQSDGRKPSDFRPRSRAAQDSNERKHQRPNECAGSRDCHAANDLSSQWRHRSSSLTTQAQRRAKPRLNHVQKSKSKSGSEFAGALGSAIKVQYF